MPHAQMDAAPQPATMNPLSVAACAALPPPTSVFGPLMIDFG